MSENILSVQNLHTSFHTDKGEVKAVRQSTVLHLTLKKAKSSVLSANPVPANP